MLARWATLPLILAACGDNASPESAIGTRLSPYVDVLPDGTQVVDSSVFRDTLRDEDCMPQPWSDGASYCTPRTAFLVYSDSGCSEPAGWDESANPGSYVAVLFQESAISKLRGLGAARPTMAYYIPKSDGGCDGPIQSGAPIRDLVELTVTSDELVRVKTLADRGDDRLEPLRELADDGAVATLAFHDTELGLDCAATGGVNTDAAACTPRHYNGASYYTDANCTVPSWTPTSDHQVDAIFANVDACPHFYAPATTTLATNLYDGTPGHCVAATEPGTHYIVGAELQLATATRSHATGSRFSVVTLTNGVPFPGAHDNTLDTDCVFDRGYCRPVTRYNDAALFSDSTCTQPIDVVDVTDGCGSTYTYAAYGDHEYRKIGDAITTPLYEISTGDICAHAQLAGVPHAVSAVIHDADLGAITHVPLR